jgi:hypothetical protein
MNKLADFYQIGVKLALDELGLLKQAVGPGVAASMGTTGTGAAPAPAAPMGGGVSTAQLQKQFNPAGMAKGPSMPPLNRTLRA